MHVKADHYLHARETAFKWHSFRWRDDSSLRLHADWILSMANGIRKTQIG